MLKRALILLALLVRVAAIETLDVDIISYEKFYNNDPETLATLKKALYEKGIVGIRDIPTYREKVQKFIETSRTFSALPEEVKEKYAPVNGQPGYELGAEKFQRPDGTWIIDNLKTSYYAEVPNSNANIWPQEIDLQTPFQEISSLMSQMGIAVMEKIGLLDGSLLDGTPQIGRMLHYRKTGEGLANNPHWCGAHFDHGIFTTLLPATYFVDGKRVPEPEEAGLFISIDGEFKKVVANDPDVLLFQVGEFGQLMTNDGIRATEHKVMKAQGAVERYTLALFYQAPFERAIYSTSKLTADARYGDKPGCTYREWQDRSLARYKAE